MKYSLNGIYVVELYLKLIDSLLGIAASNEKPIYVETHNGGIYNFQSVDFHRMLKGLIPSTEKTVDYLTIFRTLQWIICEGDRFTSVQWIHGASRRVISVDMMKYKQLKALNW